MNKLKNKLQKNEVALGTHISLGESAITELVGNIGFDYIWIDTEHTAISLDNVLHHLIAARAAGTSAIVRIPSVDPVRAKPILEMGPDGIIFPQVNSYEEALLAVKACIYPPEGIRGFGPRRVLKYGLTSFDDYAATVNTHLLKLLQIEHINAAKELDHILTIKEIDAFILGPCDFASSMGKIGDWNNPQVTAEVEKVIVKVHDAGKKIGVSFGDYSVKTCEQWKNRGVDFISLGADVDFLLKRAQAVFSNLTSVFTV